ncbi:6146_t:CDS:2 [Ambispora gerdemannii]|uniref:6146_t:CDS:1 n=1 Tax=Ambispora gerdemannii TaxID=144530 RepID=A0A9N9AS66_9GLOM|nr:6146_t:CDS:2 [Ambispora gerdemannii]
MTNLKELHTKFSSITNLGRNDDDFLLQCIEDYLTVTKITKAELFQNVLKFKTTSPKFACLLGFLYHYGIGTEVNLEEMFRLYTISAENNDPIGQAQLGRCYSDACGTEENNEKAFYWAKKSAENGNLTGAYNLADCYCWGIGTPVIKRYSFYWYQRSAEAGMNCSVFWLARCFRVGWGTNKDIHHALRLYRGIDHSSWMVEVKDVFKSSKLKGLHAM